MVANATAPLSTAKDFLKSWQYRSGFISVVWDDVAK